jgi:hypothetical protein
VDTGQPDSTSPILAGIAVAKVGGFPGDKLLAMDGVVSKYLEECSEVGQGGELG